MMLPEEIDALTRSRQEAEIKHALREDFSIECVLLPKKGDWQNEHGEDAGSLPVLAPNGRIFTLITECEGLE